jgi:hypothetical protein
MEREWFLNEAAGSTPPDQEKIQPWNCVPPVFAGNASIAASSPAKYSPKVSHMLLLLGFTMA